MTKRCLKCDKELLLSAFSKKRRNKDGLEYWCRNCINTSRKIHRAKHGAEIRARDREYYKTHKIAKAAAAKKYRAANKDKRSASWKKWYATNRDRSLVYWKKWRDANKGKSVAYGRKYRRKYPEKHRERVHRRQAAKLGNGYEKFLDIEIFERDCWVCQICGKHVDEMLKFPHRRSASLDHIVPVVDGGGHTRINVRLAHLGCNSAKGAGRGAQLRLIG